MKFTTVIVAALAGLTFTQAQAQAPAPDQLVKGVATEVIGMLKADATLQTSPQRISQLVDSKLIPHFNFARMTQFAMGRNWAKADAAQQAALTKEFRTLLVRTYSGALAAYKDRQIDTRPLRVADGDTEALVKTQITGGGASPIAIDYSMEKAADGAWKVVDIVVAGVSLVTNYRDEFGTVVRDSGVDALVKLLQTKNK